MRVFNVEQKSDEWYALRNGVITGTRLKTVLGRTSKSLLYELLAESLAPAKDPDSNEAMERGSELEIDALTLYEGKEGRELEQIGFVLHDEYDWLGVSPDALFKEGKKYVGAVEVKCPDTKTHIKYLVEGKIPSEYKAQILQYFLVCDTIEWLDFVSYDPRISLPEMQMSVVRVERADLQEDLESATEKLLKFREQWEKLLEKYLF